MYNFKGKQILHFVVKLLENPLDGDECSCNGSRSGHIFNTNCLMQMSGCLSLFVFFDIIVQHCEQHGVADRFKVHNSAMVFCSENTIFFVHKLPWPFS